MRDKLSRYDSTSPQRRGLDGGTLVITVLAVALTGFVLWAGLSWAFGLIFSALRLIFITVTVGAVAIIVLWLFGRGRRRR